MTNSKGEVLENNLEGQPIQYVQGGGNILPSLEAELEGLKKGESKRIIISKEKGFDDADDEFIVEVIVDDIRKATEQELKEGLLHHKQSTTSCSGGGCGC